MSYNNVWGTGVGNTWLLPFDQRPCRSCFHLPSCLVSWYSHRRNHTKVRVPVVVSMAEGKALRFDCNVGFTFIKNEFSSIFLSKHTEANKSLYCSLYTPESSIFLLYKCLYKYLKFKFFSFLVNLDCTLIISA